MKAKILIVEDEESLRMTLGVRLRGEGYEVDTAGGGVEGFNKATSQPFDLIILDILLPDRSGWDVCREIRQAGLSTPILFLTARTHTIDKITGLKLGADDYVTKPFDSAELIARIHVLLKRIPSRSSKGVHQFGSILVDLGRGEITRNGKLVRFAGHEFQLLQYLIERSGTPISQKELLSAIWGAGETRRTVRIHIANLRDKLEMDPKSPELILTVPGFGYKFVGSRSW
jgi:two-component system, OmpR family, alkaline phosphatase synthesis response regulator PhoP